MSYVVRSTQLLPQLRTHCNQSCPQDCRRVEYSLTIKRNDSYAETQDSLSVNQSVIPFERRIVWDSNQVMFTYISQPILTFTSYLVYCGGLMGLWFGTSAKDIIVSLIHSNIFNTIVNTSI